MHKLSKLYVYRITVEGKGHFPIDMLRHDRCVPYNDLSVSRIERVLYDTTREVRLLMYSSNQLGPTFDRWASFGWHVTYQEEVNI